MGMGTLLHRPHRDLAFLVTALVIGLSGAATISRAVDATVSTDAATSAATQVTAPSPPPLPPASAPEATPATLEALPPGDDHTEPPPNPQECRDARRQIRDQFRELNRFEKMLRKAQFGQELDALIALRAKLKQFDVGIAQECTRDRLQEFFDEQVWEQTNAFRCKVELPQQFVQIERELKRLERSATAKKLATARLDAEKFAMHLGEVKQALTAAKSGVASGSCEDANEAMQTIYEGKHPGEVNGVVQRLSDLGVQLARVRDAAVRQDFNDVLQPIIDSANEGDFREANQALNDVFNELQQLLSRVTGTRRFRGNELDQRLERLNGLIEAKLGGGSESPKPVTSPAKEPAGTE